LSFPSLIHLSNQKSVDRQIKRGEEIRDKNRKALEAGDKPQDEERPTDFSEEAAKKRYQIFKQHYGTLQILRKHFVFTVINASKTIPEVQRDILKEFKYQSSMELAEDTFSVLEFIPLVETVIANSRQQLVSRLDSYQHDTPVLFQNVVQIVKESFVPMIKRHSFTGSTLVRSTH